jgi:hypothetical protein
MWFREARDPISNIAWDISFSRLMFLVVFLTFRGKFSVVNFDLIMLLSCTKFTVRNHSSLLFKIKDGWMDGWMIGCLTELFQKCSGYVWLYDAGSNCFR